MLTRREWLKASVGLSLSFLAMPSLLSCSMLPPEPFVVGPEVNPPLGCEQLRALNPNQADC